ncbi:MAG: dihydroorotate dehydrogenase-like protein [Spirochaetales bacterium]|nr:dihydroorotate dehydrogenase-like protein [Spirochaetales bacterium]MCF7938131.1 dihydroorotate dehydrogenase-like protein [Spirochaetales bacterium]
MPDLSTKYLGLELRNPLVISSSGLTESMDKLKLMEEAGAGAIVLKSLFEEQLAHDAGELENESGSSFFSHPEAADYLRQTGLNQGSDEYLKMVESAKKTVSVPVIPSLNCVSGKWWKKSARDIQDAGADALELNIAIMPTNPADPSEEIEKHMVSIVESIKKQVDLPLAVKIGSHFTSIPRISARLREAGASSLVLFNRFYQTNIDIEKLELVSGYVFSNPDEISLPLRWISILYEEVGCELASSTGVHSGEDMIKLLLAGAQTVQICSVLYQKGMNSISTILNELTAWMDRHSFASVDEFRGILSKAESETPEYYERLQYIRALTGIN